jgi:hypothetical protein
VLGLGVALMGSGQFAETGASTTSQRQQVLRPQDPLGTSPPADPTWNEKRMRALNEDRHKSVVSDAEKLLKLARQLDVEVASNPTDEMTPEEMRKVVEIEKLAKSVKSKMALSFGGGPQFQGPAFTPDGLELPHLRQ